MDAKFNSMIDIVKGFCSTHGRGEGIKQVDEMLTPSTEDPMMPYMPSPPTTPPSIRPPTRRCHCPHLPCCPPAPSAPGLFRLFPTISSWVAAFALWDGCPPIRETCGESYPPFESCFRIPPDGPITRSRELLAEALKYAAV